MEKKNPQFNHPSRAAYELPKLIKNLGAIDASTRLTEVQRHTVDAIQSHAWGATETILDGIESLGAMMSMLGNEESVVDGHHLARLGGLLGHLAVELQHLHEVETEMATTLKCAGR
jgi:hypothetical protein